MMFKAVTSLVKEGRRNFTQGEDRGVKSMSTGGRHNTEPAQRGRPVQARRVCSIPRGNCERGRMVF